MDSGAVVSGKINRLLETVPAAQRQRLTAAISTVRLEPRTVLFEPRQHIDVVDFPRTCVVSLVTPFHDGTIVEVAAVGSEGIVGVPLALGGALAVQAICSVGGWSDRMDATTFTHEVESDGDLRKVVDDYVRAVFNQLCQAVACNRLHSTTERLGRWLLACCDRIGTDEVAITKQLLGRLLGSSEATVRGSLLTLHAARLINSHGGRITILDRPGLEARGCECYGVIKMELDGVILRATNRSRDARAIALLE
ncbi:MAG: Crp/Fnr family transcriptional regulator [Candidatus Dormiibacterota bacterium]